MYVAYCASGSNDLFLPLFQAIVACASQNYIIIFMKYVYLFFLFIVALPCTAQKRMSLAECEGRFLKKNLQLLAGAYSIDIAHAQAIQAGVWENPELAIELNAYNPEKRRLFDIGTDGEKGIALQQLIHIGGQKRNEAELAQSNAGIAEFLFKDLLRNLKFQLRQNYLNLYHDNNSLEALDTQLTNISSLILIYTAQQKKGNVPLKDLTRLQSLAISFRNSRVEVLNRVYEEQKALQGLIRSDSLIIPAPSSEELQRYEKTVNVPTDSLERIALVHRPDFQSSQKNIEAAEWNLKWQRSLSIPDITIGASYDQRGSAFANQIGMSLSLPLPLWNRNEGNIHAADAQVFLATSQKDLQELQIRQDVQFAWKRYSDALANYQLIDTSMVNNLGTVYQSILQNFQKGNVSLIEFTDFMESYHQSIVEINQIRKSFTEACEQINFITNTNIF